MHMPRDKATIKRLKIYKEGGKVVRYIKVYVCIII